MKEKNFLEGKNYTIKGKLYDFTFDESLARSRAVTKKETNIKRIFIPQKNKYGFLVKA